jgi:hypothetical protein
MSIKDAAFDLYRKIWDNPSREEIESIIKKLKPLNNKMHPAPVLGLLLYDQKKVERVLGRIPIKELSSWEERELKLLFGVHNQIQHFNRRCLAPLEATLPRAVKATNPYKEYQPPVSTEGYEALLFNLEDAEEVIKSFHEHPAFAVALSDPSSERVRRIDYDRIIPQFIRELEDVSPGGEPPWIKNYEELKHSGHPDAESYRHVAALLCLYSSLANLDQLIYHGIFQNEIIPLTRSHIVDYFWTTGYAGPGMWLLHISQIHMFVCEPADLITVNTDKPGRSGGMGDVLCCIHSTTIPGTNGGPGKMELHMIDENLNAYGKLLR